MIKVIETESGETKESYYEKYQDLIFDLLIKEKIKYIDISNQYVYYLKTIENMNNKQLAEADYCLINTIKPIKPHKGKISRDHIYRYLVKYHRFDTAPVGKELKQYVEDNNINIKGDFFQDLYLK